ncbi:ATP-binding protein [Nonomuraea sp. NPDC050556]|uniref:ATP-binding protein n=1 Tax=Nonomuraea sp. NPDC050556 TaxID=3364369 RepID=UPI0037AE47CA
MNDERRRVKELVFRLSDLPSVRDFTAAQAVRAGMTGDSVDDLVLAVNEIATNAVTHGTAKAHLRVWVEGGDLVFEIHDEGSGWLPAQPEFTAPGPRSTSGMGVWLARRLAADIAFAADRGGTTVTMRFPGRL